MVPSWQLLGPRVNHVYMKQVSWAVIYTHRVQKRLYQMPSFNGDRGFLRKHIPLPYSKFIAGPSLLWGYFKRLLFPHSEFRTLIRPMTFHCQTWDLGYLWKRYLTTPRIWVSQHLYSILPWNWSHKWFLKFAYPMQFIWYLLRCQTCFWFLISCPSHLVWSYIW